MPVLILICRLLEESSTNLGFGQGVTENKPVLAGNPGDAHSLPSDSSDQQPGMISVRFYRCLNYR